MRLHTPCLGLSCKPRLDYRPSAVEQFRYAIGFQVFGGIPLAIGKEDVGVVDVAQQFYTVAALEAADKVFALVEGIDEVGSALCCEG